MSISYPLRTARFCSAIFMASRSVIFRLTILMASFWLMPRMCMVTRMLPSVSMNSAKMRSWISGAVICKKLTAPYISPMRKVRVSPKWKEDGAIKSLTERPLGASQSPIEGELAALRMEDTVKQFQPLPSRPAHEPPHP